MSADQFVIGVDYGTDSVRSVIVNALNGQELASSVFNYPRWQEGLYCDAAHNQFGSTRRIISRGWSRRSKIVYGKPDPW